MPPTHRLDFGLPPSLLEPSVSFTFNVTETESTGEQPFITGPEKARLMHHSHPPFALPSSAGCLSVLHLPASLRSDGNLHAEDSGPNTQHLSASFSLELT